MAGTPGSAARMRPARRPSRWGGDAPRPCAGREPRSVVRSPRPESRTSSSPTRSPAGGRGAEGLDLEDQEVRGPWSGDCARETGCPATKLLLSRLFRWNRNREAWRSTGGNYRRLGKCVNCKLFVILKKFIRAFINGTNGTFFFNSIVSEVCLSELGFFFFKSGPWEKKSQVVEDQY